MNLLELIFSYNDPDCPETFISDRETDSITWITVDEAAKKTKEERIRIAKLIWR